MPCGILDQATSAFGTKDHLVRIDCEAESVYPLPVPADSRLWILDSGIKHDLVDSHYATRNAECKEALRIMRREEPSLNCLAKADEEMVEKANLPPQIRKRALHVIGEQERVLSFERGLTEKACLRDLGRLLTDSHNSSSELFVISCPELDFLVKSLVEYDEVLGARLTGGGFGGAVLAWTTTAFKQSEADRIANSYEKKFRHRPETHCFSPSEGARIVDWKQALT